MLLHLLGLVLRVFFPAPRRGFLATQSEGFWQLSQRTGTRLVFKRKREPTARNPTAAGSEARTGNELSTRARHVGRAALHSS